MRARATRLIGNPFKGLVTLSLSHARARWVLGRVVRSLCPLRRDKPKNTRVSERERDVDGERDGFLGRGTACRTRFDSARHGFEDRAGVCERETSVEELAENAVADLSRVGVSGWSGSGDVIVEVV